MKQALMCLLISAWCITVAGQTPAEKEVVSILQQSAVAWNNGNIDDFMKDYWRNDSVMYVSKNGVTYGYDNILNNYKKYFPDTASMGKLGFDILHAKQLSPEYAFVVGKYTVTTTRGNASGHFTLLFRKINGRWLIIGDHSS